jgi:L,D-transpeptidase ErfK/SrfK
MGLIEKKIATQQVLLDGAALKKALQEPSGIPVAISKPAEIAAPDPLPPF